MDETITSGSTEEDAVRGEAVTLVVAFHPDPDFLGRHVHLGPGSMTLGRDHPDSGLALYKDKRMSRSHAEIIRVREKVVVRDLQSRNGTWVNGERVDHRTLGDGDVLRVGSVAMVLRWMDSRDRELHRAKRLLGAGPAYQLLLSQVADFGPRSSVVLLEGPAGVGKGLVARALHEASGRAGPFVTFDCGAVAPGVMHSELFGHEAGAFSGARARRGGLIEQARGGTLFLDEIGDASAELQSSLLRLLEEGDYRPVGSDKPVQADVRVVAATNRDLEAFVRDERFRFDLLTRLRRLWIRIPPLADRIEDVPMIATHFARRHLDPGAILHRQLAFALLEHGWPGNVRELDAVMERASVRSSGDRMVRLYDGLFPQDPSRPPTPSKPPRTRSPRPEPDELQRLLLSKGGNVTHLARDLGVARHTVYRWVREAGIDLETLR